MKKILIPFLLAFSFTHPAEARELLVGNVSSNTISFFDEATLKPLGEVEAGTTPHEIAITPDKQFALVSNFGDVNGRKPGDKLILIDLAKKKAVQTIQLEKGSRPHGVKFISNTQALVTAQGIHALLLVDIVENKVVKALTVPNSSFHLMALDSANQFAYVSNMDSGNVNKIDLRTFTSIAETNIGEESECVVLTPDENLLLVTNRKDNRVAVLRSKDLSKVKYISTELGPVRVALFNHGQSAAVSNSLRGSIQVIDLATFNISDGFSSTEHGLPMTVPINILVRADQATAYVTDNFANEVALMDLQKKKLIKTFKAGHKPDGLAMVD